MSGKEELIVKERCSIEEVTVEVTLRLVDGEPDNDLTRVLIDYLPDDEEEAEENPLEGNVIHQ